MGILPTRVGPPVAVPPPGCAAPRLGLRLLQALALRGLMRTRERHAVPPEHRAVPGAAVQAVAIAGPNGRRLAGWRVTPAHPDPAPRPAVLLLHGWGSNASAMWPMVEPLAAAGLAVLLQAARGPGPALAARVECLIGERFDAIAPIGQIRRVRGPVLLAHGLHDTTVPFDDALRLWHARPGAEFVPVTAGHDLSEAAHELAPAVLRFLVQGLRGPARRGRDGA